MTLNDLRVFVGKAATAGVVSAKQKSETLVQQGLDALTSEQMKEHAVEVANHLIEAAMSHYGLGSFAEWVEQLIDPEVEMALEELKQFLGGVLHLPTPPPAGS